MSEHNHTPKPWTFHPATQINDHECAGNVSAIVDGEPLDVATVWKADVDDLTPVPGAIANGHLLAAAPDLFDALEALTLAVQGLECPCLAEWEQAKAALAKAKPEAAQ